MPDGMLTYGIMWAMLCGVVLGLWLALLIWSFCRRDDKLALALAVEKGGEKDGEF